MPYMVTVWLSQWLVDRTGVNPVKAGISKDPWFSVI